MSKAQITISLEQETIDALDKEVEELGISRSSLVDVLLSSTFGTGNPLKVYARLAELRSKAVNNENVQIHDLVS